LDDDVPGQSPKAGNATGNSEQQPQAGQNQPCNEEDSPQGAKLRHTHQRLSSQNGNTLQSIRKRRAPCAFGPAGSVEECGLVTFFRLAGRDASQMRVSSGRSDTTAGRTLEVSDLHEVRFVHIFDCIGLFLYGGGQGVDPNGSAIKLVDNGKQQ